MFGAHSVHSVITPVPERRQYARSTTTRVEFFVLPTRDYTHLSCTATLGYDESILDTVLSIVTELKRPSKMRPPSGCLTVARTPRLPERLRRSDRICLQNQRQTDPARAKFIARVRSASKFLKKKKKPVNDFSSRNVFYIYIFLMYRKGDLFYSEKFQL